MKEEGLISILFKRNLFVCLSYQEKKRNLFIEIETNL